MIIAIAGVMHSRSLRRKLQEILADTRRVCRGRVPSLVYPDSGANREFATSYWARAALA
jgi:hypothetical protein